MKHIIYTDGGSRGNPGPSAIGVVIINEKGPPSSATEGFGEASEPIKKYSEAIGEATNNEAEYQAVIFALKKFKALFGKEEAKKSNIEIRLDSELVANQLNHEYKIEEPNIQKLFLKVWNLMLDFGTIKFKAISREENKEADRLVNEALDKKQEKMF
ncbi:MAG: hypothetical protein A2Y98_02405 [Candidatus Portnoybacteria bacterium RBG_19FT_COMBO_36_7]|uniref:RNase H type-1 domain-containing protein n=1 Tax=Candidatus Portnoybacteria bacterium RBG_19FT_COMBO_36_7 TaxID=1801992 RepID=A0A1G2F9D6_9BACT|nr:MAG: hypothetical protein A2Y98_02405 [Candidatus Portnoybacteria bacterium RBG_19FT_COMBO_36_7]